MLCSQEWFIVVPRICLLLAWGFFILLKPAAALRFSAFALLTISVVAALLCSEMVPAKFRHTVWGSPAVFLFLLFFMPHYDISGLLAILLIVSGYALRSWKNKSRLSKAVTVCALLFAVVLMLKMFSGDWFDFYTAAAISLFGCAAWESGNIKNSK